MEKEYPDWHFLSFGRLALVALYAAATLELTARQASSAEPGPGPLQQMRLFESGSGWIFSGNSLLWTDTWGNTWSDLTPPLTADESIDGIFFLDDSHGWVVASPDNLASISMYTTNDRGQHWSAVPFTAGDSFFRGGYAKQAEITFSDATQGWVLMRRMSSSASSLGDLFSTSDGGQTWTARPYPPVAGKMLFVSPTTGWLLGGVVNDNLYRTVMEASTGFSRPSHLPRNLLRPVTIAGVRK